jgi:hypothetical protein
LNFKISIRFKQALFTAPVLFILLFTGCKKRYEDEIFLQDENFEYYRGQNSTGPKIFQSPSTLTLFPSEIHQISVNSKDPVTNNVVKLRASFIGNLDSIAQDSLIVFCHGGQYHMDYYYEQIKTMYQCGHPGKYNLLIFDYQGLGLSEGQTSINAIIEDASAVSKWLYERAVPSKNTTIYGQGLGAIAACLMANDLDDELNTPSTLILENPVARADYLLSNATQLNLPSSFVDQVHFDNINLIKSFQGRLLMLLSQDDQKYSKVINGDEIYKSHNGIYKEIHTIAAQHENLIPKFGFIPYCTIVDDFIK